MKLRNKKTGEIFDALVREKGGGGSYSLIVCDIKAYEQSKSTLDQTHFVLDEYESLAELNAEWEDYKPVDPLIKDEKVRKAVRAWAEAENCTREMNLYYTLNRQEKYITFHNPQTGSELQLCDFDSPVFQEIREYTIAELCGEEDE